MVDIVKRFYGKRTYFKRSLINGSNRAEHADQTLQIQKLWIVIWQTITAVN